MVLRGLTVSVLIAAALIIAGCDSDDDKPDAQESLGLENLEPYGDPRTMHPSEVPLPPEEEAEPESATDAAEEADDSIAPHDTADAGSTRPPGR